MPDVSRPRSGRTRSRVLAAVFVFGALVACSDQDPGLQQIEVPDDVTNTTSNTLPPCPDGGPDATTPDAGCLDADGSVRQP